VPKPEDASYMQKLVQTIQEIPETSLVTLAVGATCLVVLLLMRYLLPKWPRALIVVVLSILAVTALDLGTHGVAITGPVPTGLFTVQLPGVGWGDMSNLLAGAVAIVFVGFSESLASGRAMARKHDYRLDNNQELLAQAGACGLAGLVGGFATDGSLSKTSVADTAGQRTQMASLIDALLVLLTMLFLASLFEDLPKAALGAVVIDAMIGLISFKEPKRYWSVNRSEIWFFLIALLGLLFIGIIAGILFGLIASTAALVWRASKPPLRRLGWDAKAGRFTDADRHEGLELEPRVLLTRLDGPLFFADAARFGDGIVQMVDEADPPPGGVVVDVEAVSQTDTDGADALIDLHKSLGSRGVVLAIARVESDVLALWKRAGVIEVIGADHVFSTPRDAEDHLLREIEESRYRGDKAHPANEEGP
jgi:SulP family sulfate permease